jgi:thermostable 8-oxoguanine DNA glycosylase
MKIINFKMYKDGGSIELTTDDEIFCFDRRISTTTKDRLYNNYPNKDNSNLIENSNKLENELIEELKHYKNVFYQSSIDFFIESRNQKRLVEKLVKASNEIQKDRKSKANYIHLSEKFIQQQADERGVSFDEMIVLIQNELNTIK